MRIPGSLALYAPGKVTPVEVAVPKPVRLIESKSYRILPLQWYLQYKALLPPLGQDNSQVSDLLEL